MTKRTLLTLGLMAILACENTDENETKYVDADGDGFSEASDCNDNDANININAEEVCDEIDNDCDGEIDNNATDATTWYPDADEDGIGDEGYPTASCEAPEGYVDNAGDCDDNNASAADTENDADCDGTPTDEDCDDNDQRSTIIAEDADCDGIVTDEDCDDNDAQSTTLEEDSDCDGVVD